MAVVCNMVCLLNIKHEKQISLSLFVKYSDHPWTLCSAGTGTWGAFSRPHAEFTACRKVRSLPTRIAPKSSPQCQSALRIGSASCWTRPDLLCGPLQTQHNTHSVFLPTFLAKHLLGLSVNVFTLTCPYVYKTIHNNMTKRGCSPCVSWK